MESKPASPKVQITKDGPYMVTGSLPLGKQAIGTNAEGDSVQWVPARRACLDRVQRRELIPLPGLSTFTRSTVSVPAIRRSRGGGNSATCAGRDRVSAYAGRHILLFKICAGRARVPVRRTTLASRRVSDPIAG